MKSIHEITALAVEEKYYATQVLNHWYLDEQIEKEKSAVEIVGNTPQGAINFNEQFACTYVILFSQGLARMFGRRPQPEVCVQG